MEEEEAFEQNVNIFISERGPKLIVQYCHPVHLPGVARVVCTSVVLGGTVVPYRDVPWLPFPPALKVRTVEVVK